MDVGARFSANEAENWDENWKLGTRDGSESFCRELWLSRALVMAG